MSTTASTAAPATEATDSYPELTSPTDSVIAGDFGAMSAAEQESQRQQWKEELTRTEEEIATLRQVLVAKEATASGLKRRLGITAWREFSEDMTQGLKNLQESNAYKKAGAVANATHERAAGLWSSMTSSTSFQSISAMAGNVNKAVGAATATAKTKISQSISQQNLAGQAAPATAADGQASANGAGNSEKIPEEKEEASK